MLPNFLFFCCNCCSDNSPFQTKLRQSITAFQYLKGDYKKDGDKLFLAGPVAIAQGIMVLNPKRADVDWI